MVGDVLSIAFDQFVHVRHEVQTARTRGVVSTRGGLGSRKLQRFRRSRRVTNSHEVYHGVLESKHHDLRGIETRPVHLSRG